MTASSTGSGVLSMRPFVVLWCGQAVSLLGSHVAQFALIWWLTLETGSAKILATAMLVGLLPQVLVGPLAGALIDRWSRQRILVVSDGLVAAVSLALAALYWAGAAAVWHVLAALLVRAVAMAFHQPTMAASTSLMVPARHLSRVQGVNKSLEGLLMIVSAPLAGALLGVLTVAPILALDVVTALFAIAPLFVIRVPQPDRGGEREPTSVVDDVLAGLAYLRARPGLLLLVALCALVNLFVAPAGALTSLLVTQHFEGTALQFAWMASAFGLGVAVGGVVLGVWGGFRRRIATALTAMAGLGLSLAGVGLAPASAYYLAVAAMLTTGFMMTMINGPVQAALQATVAPEYQGRVFTSLQTLALLAVPLGLAIAGPMADLVGVRVMYVAAGVACLVQAAVGFSLPMVLYLEDESRSRRNFFP